MQVARAKRIGFAVELIAFNGVFEVTANFFHVGPNLFARVANAFVRAGADRVFQSVGSIGVRLLFAGGQCN
jgi:hypothetical protein